MSENVFAAPRKADTGCVQPDLDAFTLDDLPDGARDILVLVASQLRSSTNQGDFTPKPAVHLREFQADVAAAHDNQVMGKEVHVHDGAVGQVRNCVDARHLRHRCATAHVDEYPI